MTNKGARHLAAAIIFAALDDLRSSENTGTVYAAFFYTNYCKGLFDLAGVVYDRNKITRMIADRPKRRDTTTKVVKYGGFKLSVVDGYITKITDKGGALYHFERVRGKKDKYDVTYYFVSAYSRLRHGDYKIVRGC